MNVNDQADIFTGMLKRITALERAASTPPTQRITAGYEVDITTDASGDYTVTFATPFPTAPIVVVTRENSSATETTIKLTVPPTTTGFTVRLYSGAVAQASATGPDFHWVAVGTN